MHGLHLENWKNIFIIKSTIMINSMPIKNLYEYKQNVLSTNIMHLWIKKCLDQIKKLENNLFIISLIIIDCDPRLSKWWYLY